MRKMIAARLAGAASLAMMLSACGGGGQAADGSVTPAPTPRSLAADEKPSGAMTYWGKKIDVSCPSRIVMPERAQGAPVDDVRGLRLGIPGETAIRFAQCEDGSAVDSVLTEGNARFGREERGLKIRSTATVAVGSFPDRWNDRSVAFGEDATTRLKAADAIWHFVMDGMPGKEKLYAAWLDQPFADGAMPTLASQITALKAKYGEPNHVEGQRLYWLYLPDGKPIPAFNRDLIARCSQQISPGSQQLSFGPDCGLTIVAEVSTDTNPALARRVGLALFEPAKLYDYQTHRFEAERDAVLAAEAGNQASNAKGGSF